MPRKKLYFNGVEDVALATIKSKQNAKVRKKRNKQPERALCKAAYDMVLNLQHFGKAKKTFRVIHISNEGISGSKGAIYGAHQKAMGKKAGVSDFLIYATDSFAFAEAKTENGYLSQAQKEFKKDCELLNIPFFEFKSVEEFINNLKDLGYLKGDV